MTTLPSSCAVVMKSGNLNFLEPSGPLQACNGTALPYIYIYIYVILSNCDFHAPLIAMKFSVCRHIVTLVNYLVRFQRATVVPHLYIIPFSFLRQRCSFLLLPFIYHLLLFPDNLPVGVCLSLLKKFLPDMFLLLSLLLNIYLVCASCFF